MRPNNTACKSCDTRAENHPSPPILNHTRQAQLREQERCPAICPPRHFKVLDADLADVFDTRLAEGEARVVEQDGRVTEFFDDCGVEGAGGVVGGEVGLKGVGFDVEGLKLGDEGLRCGGGRVVVDGD